MKKAISLLMLGMLLHLPAQADVRETFIQEVVKQCGVSKDQAEAMATGGRQGNVMKWRTCTSATVTIDSCTMTCSSDSSSIGG